MQNEEEEYGEQEVHSAASGEIAGVPVKKKKRRKKRRGNKSIITACIPKSPH